MQNYSLLRRSGKIGRPVLLKRALVRHHRGVADGRRVRDGERQPQRDALRARHPHLRDRHPQHPRHQRGPGAAPPDPPAGDRRPVARHRAALARASRSRWPRPRSAPTASSSRCTPARRRPSPTAPSRSPSSSSRKLAAAVRPIHERDRAPCTGRAARRWPPPGPLSGRHDPCRPTQAVVARPRPPCVGSSVLPGDKSISHRALLLALLADGESRHRRGRRRTRRPRDGRDLRGAAATVVERSKARRPKRPSGETPAGGVLPRAGQRPNANYRVVSPGHAALAEPDGPLDCLNSGTTLRLACRDRRLAPDLRRARRRRVLRPVRWAASRARSPAMGAASAAGERHAPPARDHGRPPVAGDRSCTPVPSAQVKSCASCSPGSVRTASRPCARRSSRATTPSGCCGRGACPCARSSPRRFGRALGRRPRAGAAVRRARPRRHQRCGLLARRGRVAPGRGAHPPERRHEPLAAWDHRPAPPDGCRHRRASRRRRRPSPERRRADRRPRRAQQRAARHRDRARRGGGRDRRDPGPLRRRRGGRGRTTIRGVGELRRKESDRVAGIVDGLRLPSGPALTVGERRHSRSGWPGAPRRAVDHPETTIDW